jgi:ribose-phosphate pyrophosphokinase
MHARTSRATERDPVVFALHASRDFGERVAAQLGLGLAEHEERDFPEGEHKARPLVNVRDRDVYVIHSLHGDDDASVNDKLCRLLFFAGALRDASAGRITALVPYLCYSRKDRKTQTRDPVTTRYVAALFEAVGVDRVVTIDAHNLAAFQNAFRCRTDHLEARPLLVEHFASVCRDVPVVVLSPDAGGIKRAERFREGLARRLERDVAIGLMEKQRALGEVSGESLFAQVDGKTVVIVDDLIGTGTTMERAARACVERGATRVYATATHGLFVGDASAAIGSPALAGTVVTDTVPPFRLTAEVVEDKLVVLPAAGLFSAAIEAIHTGGSIVELLEV